MWILELSLWLLLVAAAGVFSTLVLLQDSKGGGLVEAFGGTGGETFGTGARGVRQTTWWIGLLFLVAAVLTHVLRQAG